MNKKIKYRMLDILKYRQQPPNNLALRNIARLAESLFSSIRAQTYKEDFQSIDCFCLFVGHPRSGHSLIGSLLDAHPQMVIAHEYDVIGHLGNSRHLLAGISERQLYYLLLERSKWFANQGAKWTGYKYDVPSQYKGEYKEIKVIGDKKGGGTSLALRHNPHLIEVLQDTISVPVKIIHVFRHPLDNIATMARKCHGGIDSAIDAYFRRCEGVYRAKKKISDMNWLSICQEKFVKQTNKHLARTCQFFKVKYSDIYLKECSSIVFDSPNYSRKKVKYTSNQVREIELQSKRFKFLSRYSFRL